MTLDLNGKSTAGADGDTPAALSTEMLSVGYGETVVLRGVSISVAEGEVVALLGANGAGKTTLLRAVSGLIPSREGRILSSGRDVTRRKASSRAAMGICHIPEGRGIYRSLSVRENLVVQAPRTRTDEAIEQAVSTFPVLGRRLGQIAGTLSGGEQQMLAFVAAYIRDPYLILVDEASFGLAPIVVDEIFDFISARAAAGTAVLLVDQYATRVLSLASSAYVLRRGQIVFNGAAKDLLSEELFHYYLAAPACAED